MTQLLDQAIKAASSLPPEEQDEIARIVMNLAGAEFAAPIALSRAEREAIVRSRAAAERGEFSTDEEVRAVWSQHGL